MPESRSPSLHEQIVALPVFCLLVLLSACDISDNEGGGLGVPGSNYPGVVNVPASEMEGPIAGPLVLVSTFFSLPGLGYQQDEYFVSGTANAYVNSNELQSDGRWEIEATGQANYKTRIVINRPSDPADFNGTVVVEWLNVSASFDSAPDWGMLHTELIRSGYAWVGVSAQKEGVTALLNGRAASLIGLDVGDRYASLHHPGDGYSYDIYSQITQALRSSSSLLGDLVPQRFIAAGESQSAGRLMTYVNAFAPMHALFDGYYIHSRTGGSAALQGSFFTEILVPTPAIVNVRSDLDTPVMMLQTETDLFILGSYPSNQADSDTFRLWEVAGSAHADLYTFLDNRFDVGTNPSIAAIVEEANPVAGFIECPVAVNAGPQHWVAKAAMAALNDWVTDGTPPPQAERLSVSGSPPAFDLDSLGNVLGGIRTPYVDVPIAVLSGGGQPQVDFDPDNRNFCFLSGTTELFDAATLAMLYTDNASYIQAVIASANDAVAKGFLLPADADLIKTHAQTSNIFAQ